MRSSMASGNSYAASTQGVRGGFGSANILGKIPLNPSQDPPGSTHLYMNPVGTDTMFNFNGGEIDKMDLFFTKEFTDEEVDFAGFHFTITIGIWTQSMTAR
jgi:hypothetical protein